MDENRNIDPKLEEALKGIWDSLTDEQKEKAKACKTLDELAALAGKEGVELPDELLDAVAGGYVVYDRGLEMWVAYSDDGMRRKISDYSGSKEEAERLAREEGWSTEEKTEAQILRKSLGYC
ncbi:MAG: hypothetical protein E7422_06410 [Ruminococcaceae bacterium]|jgi:hypothetical protein|nr:hypothetical protein [Oscillospiraceae bacterium]